MTLEQARQIVEFIEENLWDEVEEIDLREEYSGRGMYGRTVPAIVIDNPTWIGYAAGALGIEPRDIPQRTDSMGLSTVVY
jgi:hypothetical protein